VNSLRFSRFKSMSPVNSFYFSFPIWMPVFSFYFLIALVVRIEVVRTDIFGLFLIIEKTIQFSITKYYANCGLFIDTLFSNWASSIPSFSFDFFFFLSWGVLDFVSHSSASIEMNMWLLSLFYWYSIYSINWFFFSVLTNFAFLVNPTWSRYKILVRCYWTWFSSTLLQALCLYSLSFSVAKEYALYYFSSFKYTQAWLLA